jgi:Ca-activated chloride channel family protein
MTFLEPGRLLLGIAVVAVALGYLAAQVWGRRRAAVRFTNLELLASVAPRRPGWRRHVPATLLLVALASMVLALARPTRAERVPRERATIIMAIDVSISMDATDVSPSRLDAAKAAATSFAGLLPEQINLGLVAFAGSATVPRAAHDRARRRLQRDRAADPGGGRRRSARPSWPRSGRSSPCPTWSRARRCPPTSCSCPTARPPPAPPNELAVEAALDADVPVTTIAFGTDAGTIEYQGETLPGAGQQRRPRALADATGGSAFEAATGEQLRSVYEDIGSSIGFTEEQREVGEIFTGAPSPRRSSRRRCRSPGPAACRSPRPSGVRACGHPGARPARPGGAGRSGWERQAETARSSSSSLDEELASIGCGDASPLPPMLTLRGLAAWATGMVTCRTPSWYSASIESVSRLSPASAGG